MIYAHYQAHGRTLPWRKTTDPYRILVSEIMLQQTQVDRVIEKYKEFLKAFPNVRVLARAPLKKVLQVWQGLGYNRRALFLQRAAKDIVTLYKGRVPASEELLARLPGIGKATASAICAYAFNMPVIYIETNIRAVFIHHFFRDTKKVSDEQLLPLVEQTLDRKDPRKWYNALMDYGTKLKKEQGNPARKSAHHVKQSRFEGSNRQIRGAIVQVLSSAKGLTLGQLAEHIPGERERVERVLKGLLKEGMISRNRDRYYV